MTVEPKIPNILSGHQKGTWPFVDLQRFLIQAKLSDLQCLCRGSWQTHFAWIHCTAVLTYCYPVCVHPGLSRGFENKLSMTNESTTNRTMRPNPNCCMFTTALLPHRTGHGKKELWHSLAIFQNRHIQSAYQRKM